MGLGLGEVGFGRACELEELALQTFALGDSVCELLLEHGDSVVAEMGAAVVVVVVLEVEAGAAAGHGEDEHVDALPPRPAGDDAGRHGWGR